MKQLTIYWLKSDIYVNFVTHIKLWNNWCKDKNIKVNDLNLKQSFITFFNIMMKSQHYNDLKVSHFNKWLQQIKHSKVTDRKVLLCSDEDSYYIFVELQSALKWTLHHKRNYNDCWSALALSIFSYYLLSYHCISLLYILKQRFLLLRLVIACDVKWL